MKDPSGTNPEVIEEISSLRQRVKELEQFEVIHKQTEDALRQFRSRVEAMNEWVWEINSDGFYTYSSPKIKDFLGYEPEELIGKTPFDLMPKYEADRVAPAFKEITESHQSFSGLENVNLHKDGREIMLETNGAPIIDAEGHFVGYRGIDRDITERKQAETALRASEAKWKEIFETIQDLYYEIDSEEIIKLLSPSVRRLSGWNEEDLLGKSVTTVYADPHDRERLLSKLSEKGYLNDYELVLKKKDGEERQVSLSARTIFDDNGRPIGVRGLLRDITERKLAEEALHKSEEKYRLIFDYSPIGLLSFDGKGVIVACNDNFVKIIGSSREKLIGLNMVNLPDKNIVLAVQKALNGSQGFHEGVYSSVTAKKNTPVRCLFTPINVGGGGITGGGWESSKT